MNRSRALHVSCAAPIDETVAQFPTERRHGPTLRFGHYDVSVTEQDKGTSTAIAFDASVEIRTPRCYVEYSRLDPIRLQQLLQVQSRGALVTRRVGSVDSDQFLQQLNCFVADFGPIDIGRVTWMDHEQQDPKQKQKTSVHIHRLI